MSERRIDPVTLSTVWHAFQRTAREMRHVVDRTAQSYLLAQLHDMAAGIWDAPVAHDRRARGPDVDVPVAEVHGADTSWRSSRATCTRAT